MNALGLAFTVVCVLLVLGLPRRWAFVPVLLSAAWMTRGQELLVGPAHFTVLRIVVAAGILRLMIRRESVSNGLQRLDRWILVWAAILFGTSGLHAEGAWVYRAGLIWTELGCYFLFRVFLREGDDVVRAFKVMCLILLPVAASMAIESATRHNAFAALGGVPEIATVRAGKVRATGPFAHPILAGTVGAIVFPMALALWQRHRAVALLGLLGSCGVVAACASSGPVVMTGAIMLGLLLWHLRGQLRGQLRLLRWLSVIAILLLAAVMNDPVYFLMARIDISGGSQGYFRAQLIRSSIEHLDEWWLSGTDRTRHWMSTGTGNAVHPDNADITNHFLAMGVMGGLLLMAAFIAVVISAFKAVGVALRERQGAPVEQQYLAWTLGATLFGLVIDFLSISLYDQSVVFFQLVLAAIGSVRAAEGAAAAPRTAPARPGYLDLLQGPRFGRRFGAARHISQAPEALGRHPAC